MEFHAPQVSHRPAHLPVTAAQEAHIKRIVERAAIRTPNWYHDRKLVPYAAATVLEENNNVQSLGFLLMANAFIIAAMQRHLETRGRNDPEANSSRATTLGMAGAVGVMAVSFVFLAGGAKMWALFGPILAVGSLGALVFALNYAAGGAELIETAPKKLMAWLEKREEFLGKYVFPFTSLIALAGMLFFAIDLYTR
jgi:hypothetical protein